MNEPAQERLARQYATLDRFLTRVETHRLYSEAPGAFVDWLLDVLDPQPGDLVLDAGCGPGIYHAGLAARGARIVAIDLFPDMVRTTATKMLEDGRPAGIAQADVQRLPFVDASFDRVMCNHMLYHVPDIKAALQDLRRVARPRSRIVLATNGSDNMAVLDRLHRQACAELGLTPLAETEPLRFTFEPESVALVRSVFPGARVHLREDALVFPDVDAVLGYYATFGVDQVAEPRPAASADKLLARMAELVGDTLRADGQFRVQKSAGCYVCDIPR